MSPAVAPKIQTDIYSITPETITIEKRRKTIEIDIKDIKKVLTIIQRNRFFGIKTSEIEFVRIATKTGMTIQISEKQIADFNRFLMLIRTYTQIENSSESEKKNVWVCRACAQTNPSTTWICKGCGADK